MRSARRATRRRSRSRIGRRHSLEELIGKVFAGRIIEEVDHPALLRLIGEKQDLK